eukprot:2136561-Rhodomonas_salina.2
MQCAAMRAGSCAIARPDTHTCNPLSTSAPPAIWTQQDLVSAPDTAKQMRGRERGCDQTPCDMPHALLRSVGERRIPLFAALASVRSTVHCRAAVAQKPRPAILTSKTRMSGLLVANAH